MGVMTYWIKIGRLALKESAALVGFGNAERAIVTIALQAAIAILIYLVLGMTALRDNATVRVATAVAPMAVFPLIFVWKLLAIPSQLYKEQLSEAEREQHTHLVYLANMYVNEENPENAATINYGLLNPPEEWVNGRLAAYGFDWRVRLKPGAKVEFYPRD